MGYYEFKEMDALEFARASGILTKRKGDELQFQICPYCRGGRNGDKQEQLRETLWNMVDELPGQQASVVRMRYQEGISLQEVSERIGYCYQRAAQIQQQALRELRYGLSKIGLSFPSILGKSEQ